MPNNNEIILFGCWNQGICDYTTGSNNGRSAAEVDENTTKNGMSAVMKNLSQYCERDPPEFIVVLGDNYYPEKENKEKLIDFNALKSGFNCLKNLKTINGINLLMGNHDLQQEIGIKNKIDKKVQNECIITTTEIKNINANIDIKSYGRLLGKHTICLFICSTLYTKKADEIIKCMGIYRNEYKDICIAYSSIQEKLLPKHPDLFKSLSILMIKKIRQLELHKLRSRFEELKSNLNDSQLQNLIICGHEPIVSRRYKIKKNTDVKDTLLPEGIQLLNQLYDMASQSNNNVKKYYLCADVHQYQEGIVNIINNQNIRSHEIHQFVVGVGGTECDEKCISNSINDEQIYPGLDQEESIFNTDYYSITYKMKRCERNFGYLSCKDNNNNGQLEFEFMNVLDCDNPFSGGGKRVTKKKRYKKGKTKKNKSKLYV